MSKLPRTLGELRASGYQPRRIREEIRHNMIVALRERRPIFPGIIGYDETVIPQVVHAVLAEHNFLLLGQRGQAKTRLIRSLTDFLDDTVPIIDGSLVPEDPLRPMTPTGRRLVAEAGDDLPIAWLERADRYQEKLATPDVTIADLIGDIDPIKAMSRKLDFSNEEVIHYGIVPRSNRCIFAINELPDLQPRIQVGLLNILEERDFQIRGFPIRMEIDIFMVFTANPEDYTNRGNIITPLKDRIEAQIITHYPATLEDGIAIIRQEALSHRNGHLKLHIGDLFLHLIEQTAIEARQSDYVDRGSGVSARMPITLLETVRSAMERRALLTGDDSAHARICDLYQSISAITGKVELVYKGEQEGIAKVAEHLIGRAVRERFNELFVPNYRHGRDPKYEFPEFLEVLQWFEAGNVLELADTMPQAEFEKELGRVTGLRKTAQAKFPGQKGGELAAAMEFLLEGLAQNFMLTKFRLTTGTRYADELFAMKADD
ncbi:MAG TPA: magnesium chelatase [Candidatus Sumerlaeota bacterium]|nr:magnesium chelatase [Candidatus Sumerlaeota bacterium]